ncbi:MAG: putative DNA binding domain-containing protein [Alistipes sp.]|nr:putative DNA binding domain-containing protein [Alistipes sp.]
MTREEIFAGESKNVEFKVSRPEKSIKYMKSVVAFANGKGGRIVFGIDDDTREIVGIPEDSVFHEMDAITNAISDSCEPVIVPDVYPQSIDGKTIIIAEISAGRQKPYYIRQNGITDGVYMRVSGTSRKADRTMTQEMYYESEGRSYDSVICRDLVVSEEDIKKLCSDMKEVALANCKNAAQRQSVKNVTKNILLNWGILAEDEEGVIYPTNAYIFLTGQDTFLSKIQCGMFKGTTRAVFVDKRDYEGPLWQQAEEAFRFVLRNIRLGARIEGLYRKDIYELPPDSIRELIMNAVMNCSFLQSSHIQVAIYDDRLEITSPGGLMPGVTIDRMKEGYSQIRNRALAHAFSYMNLIEGWGTGIPRLIREMKEYGLPEPEFVDMEIALRINLYRAADMVQSGDDKTQKNVKVRENQKVRSKCAQSALKRDLTAQEIQIIDYINDNGSITSARLMELLNIKKRRAQVILSRMAEDGLILKKGASRSTNYVL